MPNRNSPNRRNISKRSPNSSDGHRTKKKSSFKSSLLIFLFKLLLTLLALLGLYCVYLDVQVRRTMDGEVWKLPAEIYSAIPTITINDSQSKILNILAQNGYRETYLIVQASDYKREGNNLLLLTRAFPFPNNPKPERLIRLYFQNTKLVGIEDVKGKKMLTDLQFAPKLIDLWQSEKEDRLVYSLDRYPELLINTLISTEDRSFYSHLGVNPMAIGRAVYANLMAGHNVQGGSTITQQVVKNIFLSSERSISRKANEALMAIIMEAHYSKERILETYLNEVYLGQMGDKQINGFALASLFYFNRPISEISLDQMALLVGMVKGPSYYNPWRNPQRALERRNVVLGIMVKNGILTENTYKLLKSRPLGVQANGQIRKAYPAFMQLLRQQLKNNLGANINHLSGTKIFTTLDLSQQKAAEQSILATIPELRNKTKLTLETAMMVVNYRSGAVKAMVGGYNAGYAGLNRALDAKRQIGSLVKPSIYLTALMEPNKFSLKTLLGNQPISLRQADGSDWIPKNYKKEFSEDVTMLEALTRSLNIPTVNLGLQTGLRKIIKTQKAMGWDSIPSLEVPAILLGSYSLTPFEVSKLFQTIANEGKSLPLFTINYITNIQGVVLYENQLEPKQVVPAQASFLTLYAMQNVVRNGTGRGIFGEFGNLNLAGKTGTSNQARDAWWVGVDNNDLTTIWVGVDNNAAVTLKKFTGATAALPIYKSYLERYSVEALQLKVPPHIQWGGISYSNTWDCSADNKIPFWSTPEDNCQNPKPASKSSIWDFFKF